MKITILTAILALTLSAGAYAQTGSGRSSAATTKPATTTPTLEEVISKHLTAVGGMDKVKSVNTITYDQSMSVMGMDMTGKTTSIVGKASRVDISVMGQNMTTVINGETGWMVNPMMGSNTPQVIPAEQAKMQQSNTEVTGLQVAYAQLNNFPMTLVGKETLDGKEVFNVKVTRPEATVNFYINASDYRLSASKATVSAQGQTAEVKANFSNFKSVEGLTLPFTIDMEVPGMPAPMKVEVTKIVLNPSVDEAIFKMPGK